MTTPRARAVLLPAACAFALAFAAAPAAPARRDAPPARGASPAPAIEEHLLANGMKLVLVPRHLSPTVAGAWVARVGSANERPGITGISHLFEHMMFKGTHVIGTRDYEKDVRLIEQQEALQDSIRAELSALRAAQRRGELDDMTKPESKTPRMRELEKRFDGLVAEQRANMVKNEFNTVLQRNGATGINAFTNNDMTVYFETVPANRLELWFWMEADRLRNRVFREFYSERDVVYEERRLRTESTPTGKFAESFDAVFWDASPYAWPVVGWPSDVASITRAQADEYYALYYQPQNLTAVLVGDFDPKAALALAERYLGAIPPGARPAPEMITMESRSLAEKRFHGEAETNPAATVRWHTVAFTHRDAPVLEIVDGLLTGPAGRLRRSLVLKQGVATSARAAHEPLKYEGSFEITAEAKEGRTPEEVEQAIYGEVERLKSEPVGADELQAAKNRYLTAAYRQLNSNFLIGLRYAVSEGRGDLHGAERIEAAVQGVTSEDVQRVAQAYFTKEGRAVAIWTRKGGGAEDPELAALPPPARERARAGLARIRAASDPEKLQQMLDMFDQMGAQMPPEAKPAIEYLRGKAQARLRELSTPKP
ncbi:MAG: insulinase family protein [Candidatus Eisenbacteria bacterium]|nr:insulinase family protein [Candidatus Eisenbacteria bacterium]